VSASYTIDLFSSLDGFGGNSGDWGGYWGKQGPQLLERRLALYSQPCHMVFGANTYRLFVKFMSEIENFPDVEDPWGMAMINQPATVISSTLREPLQWPDAELVPGDAVEVVTRMKQDSDVPLRSHGSLSMNRSLMAAGLVDYLQVTIFPVLTGATGEDPLFAGYADFDLELTDSRLLDGQTQELIYHPTLHR